MKIKYPLILGVACFAAAGVAVGVARFRAADKPGAGRHSAYESALRTVLPEAESFSESFFDEVGGKTVTLQFAPGAPATVSVEDPLHYALTEGRKGGRTVGYATVGMAQGYSSRLVVLAGFTPDLGKVIGINVLSQQETPGLGTKCVEEKSASSGRPWFQAQFNGVPAVALTKRIEEMRAGGIKLDAITGATITSEAVRKAVLHAWRRASAARELQRGELQGTER